MSMFSYGNIKMEISLTSYCLREGIKYKRDLPVPSTESHSDSEEKVH